MRHFFIDHLFSWEFYVHFPHFLRACKKKHEALRALVTCSQPSIASQVAGPALNLNDTVAMKPVLQMANSF